MTKGDHQERLDHSKGLLKQGQTFDDEAALWADVVSKLPDSTIKFALNAAQDCLPHNQNLFLWKKKPSDSYPLCGHTQSLVHVLNNCCVALQLRRYNKRHDAVLKSLSDFISSNLPPDFQQTADLPKSKFNPPPCIKLGDLRPDIVYWSESQKAVVIIELTICYDTLYSSAHERKKVKYKEGYKANLVTIEIGSRGFISINTIKSLISLTPGQKQQTKGLLKVLIKTVITESFDIYKSRNITNLPLSPS